MKILCGPGAGRREPVMRAEGRGLDNPDTLEFISTREHQKDFVWLQGFQWLFMCSFYMKSENVKRDFWYELTYHISIISVCISCICSTLPIDNFGFWVRKMADKHTCLTEEKLSTIIRTIFYEKLQKQEQNLLNIIRNVEVDGCHLKENLFAQSTLLTN